MSRFSFGRFVRSVLILGLGSFLPAIGSAQTPAFPASTGTNTPACTANTALTAYESANTNYNVGCMVGTAAFYHFSATAYTYDTGGNSTGSYDPSANIFFSPGATGNPTIIFSSLLFSIPANSGSLDIAIEYYIDPPIDILGLGLADAPFQNSSVYATVCIDNTFAVNCPVVTDGEFIGTFAANVNQNRYTTQITPLQQTSYVAFDRSTKFNDVQLFIDLESTATQGASIPSFGQSALTTIPEPDELALASIGMVALSGTTLRRRRRTKAEAA